jgi:hypothetical protein
MIYYLNFFIEAFYTSEKFDQHNYICNAGSDASALDRMVSAKITGRRRLDW